MSTNSSYRKIIALFLLLVYSSGMALNMIDFSGGQPEVMAFEQAGTSDMVDLFSGDFKYNIPLFELPGPNGGYPFNLSYQAGIAMTQDASWVGLGWNLAAGSILRQMRGFPDEFNGGEDSYTLTKKMDPSITLGVGAGLGFEVFGRDNFLKAFGDQNPDTEIGFSVYQNNYKGVGYSLDGGTGYNFAVLPDKISSNVGLNFSIDSQEGTSVSPSLSLSGADNNRDGQVVSGQISLGYHSRYGMQNLSFGTSMTRFIARNNEIGGSISFSQPALYPQVFTPMKNFSANIKFKGGLAWWGLDGNAYVRGFYNKQQLEKELYSFEPYGYLNLQNATANSLMDFNREKDGPVHKKSPNLPIPNLTYDIFNVTAQGISGMFRPYRSDMGLVWDNDAKTTSTGGGFGVDVSPASSHVGGNLSAFHASSKSGGWREFTNEAESPLFTQNQINSAEEAYYFKFHGEHNATDVQNIENIGGGEPVSYGYTPAASNATQRINNGSVTFDNAQLKRIARPQSLIALKVEDIYNKATDETVTLFSNIQGLDRSDHPANHLAGFVVTAFDGKRYVYGLPVYNLEESEVTFKSPSQSGSFVPLDEAETSASDGNGYYYQKSEISKYPYAFLLTSVLGPDYVDINRNGVDDSDKGYWVSFNYDKGANSTWKTPYGDAFYDHGYLPDQLDDRGSYKEGIRENYYLSFAETKTHYVNFNLGSELRLDGRNVASSGQDYGSQALPRLESISLFAKGVDEEEDAEIQTVHLDYDYSLCSEEVGNNKLNSSTGKLTLKGMHTTYPKSDGIYNNYQFGYCTQSDQESNYMFDLDNLDRWGTYKEGDDNRLFPYVDQSVDRSTMDMYASAWNLDQVILPSGAVMEVKYEADDYAYVQHKPTLEMFPLVDNQLNPSGKIRFWMDPQRSSNVEDYLDGLENDQVYFKARVNLKSAIPDYVSGYFTIDRSAGKEPGVEIDGEATYGYFYAKLERDDYHPISLRAWGHIRTNQPRVISQDLVGDLLPIDNVNNEKQAIEYLKALGAGTSLVKNVFTNYNQRASDKGWASTIDAEESWIRLKTPNKVKVGGGHRVKQLILTNPDDGSVYGQHYFYSLPNNAGSSGVASYEPMVGGDENPFRTAKRFSDNVPLNSDNNLYFENPPNEGYFPGASVGYRRVEVLSLAASAKADESVSDEFEFPEEVDFGTTGKKVFEFYTTKDFPYLTSETSKSNNVDKDFKLIPFLGSETYSHLLSSQGYLIQTNDMNGKLKRISAFEQFSDGSFSREPVSYTHYKYRSKDIIYQNEQVKSLINTFKSSSYEDQLEAADADAEYYLGVEYDIFGDARSFENKTYEAGANINLDVLVIFIGAIPVPTVWPNVTKSESVLKTVVVNKVLFQSGILEAVESMQDGAVSVTTYERWDKYTGRPLLQRTEDRFSSTPLYAYSEPAYLSGYDGMGLASDNLGLAYSLQSITPVATKSNEFEALVTLNSSTESALFAGDEIIIKEKNRATEEEVVIGTAVYLGKGTGAHRYYSEVNFGNIEIYKYSAMIIRSGRRNLLSVSKHSMQGISGSSLQNPTTTSLPEVLKLVPVK